MYRAEIFKCLAGSASELGAEQRALPMLNVGCGNSGMHAAWSFVSPPSS